MLMAHSIEGRFPFLDPNVVALADSLPARYKLRALDEKHVLRRAAERLVPAGITARPNEPYRAPDALAFAGAEVPRYVEEMLAEPNVADAGIFEPKAVAQLWNKCRSRARESHFSNTDNMAFIGVLSTQLVHDRFVRQRPGGSAQIRLCVDVEK